MLLSSIVFPVFVAHHGGSNRGLETVLTTRSQGNLCCNTIDGYASQIDRLSKHRYNEDIIAIKKRLRARKPIYSTDLGLRHSSTLIETLGQGGQCGYCGMEGQC